MLTTDQVTALAPDAASFKAGRALASPRKWQELGQSEVALWGLALGSGKKPYYTQVDLSDLATKCSCPSRKFPCKHALGLMFIAADSLDSLATGSNPDWVEEWLTSRQARSEKAATKKAAKPKDEAAAAKRKDKRSERVDSGIELLDQAIHDTLRSGLGNPTAADPETWHELARRMVDAQAPGIAGALSRLADLPHSGSGWENVLLGELGSLHLLSVAYRQREKLEPNQRADVEQLVGWPLEKEEILKGKGVRDHWFVAARSFSERNRLVTCSTWLYGQESKRWALVLQFSVPPSQPAVPWPLGSVVETELVYLPGTSPDRVLPRLESATAAFPPALPEAPDTVTSLLQRSADCLAKNPWQARQPFFLAAQPVARDSETYLVDSDGLALPWKAARGDFELLTSLCAGRPIPVAGIWDGRFLNVLSANDGSSLFSLKSSAHPSLA
ncbi:SWIM zinc finger family protein [Verrucomicrobiaceae bacterium 227]